MTPIFLATPYNDYGDVGYDFLISGDGTIYEGRSLDYKGAHLFGYNQGNIGIAFLGDFSEKTISSSQFESGLALVGALDNKFNFKRNGFNYIRTHGEIDSKKHSELMGARTEINRIRRQFDSCNFGLCDSPRNLESFD